MNAKDVTIVVFATFIFCFSFATVFHLGCFLSSQTNLNPVGDSGTLETGNILHEDSKHTRFWSSLLVDFCLVILFMMQHSIQAKLYIKNLLCHKGLEDFERLFYNGATCVSLQIMMRYWHPISNWALWEISSSNSVLVWYTFSFIHIIYSECLIMDMLELMGIKQVYYSLQGWADPLSKKSESLCRLYRHMRHPSFSAFCVILLIHPVMQIDRLMLAYVLVIYMILAFKVDEIDYSYHKKQLRRKEISLQFSKGS